MGAGAGGFLETLAALGGTVHHTDRSLAILRTARDRRQTRGDAAGSSGAGVVASGAALPFRDAAFDLACLFDVLEHVEDDAAALRELRRVLAEGGRLFLHVPAHPILFAHNDRVARHFRRYTRAGLVARVRAAGFEVERATFTNAILFPAIAGTILGLKALNALGIGGDATHRNLSLDPPRWVHRLLEAAFRAELVVSRTRDLPLGHSIALLARR